LSLARRQGAKIFALRAAVDLVKLNGESAFDALTDAVDAFPPDSTWPELTSARALLG
jgi:hypothetical protein